MKYIFLLFSVAFGGVAVGLFLGLILPDIQAQSISRTGASAVATVTGYNSNTEINGVPYYRISFYFTNPHTGETKEGRTNSSYTYFQAQQISQQGTLNIKVSKSGRAVAADFRKTAGNGFLWIFIIVFGAVGLGMDIAFVLLLVVSVSAAKIKRKGYDGEGNFISSSVGYYMNNSPVYKITFSFKDQNGEEHIQKTQSKYSSYQAQGLENLGAFDIKYLGNRAVITHKVTYKDVKNSPINSGEIQSTTMNNSTSPQIRSKMYHVVFTEIKRCKTEEKMHEVLEKYSRSLQTQEYFDLRDEIYKLNNK